MTRAQYDAVIEIADNHGRFKACDLNIRTDTVKAMAEAMDALVKSILNDVDGIPDMATFMEAHDALTAYREASK